jgi:hypothetical protein
VSNIHVLHAVPSKPVRVRRRWLRRAARALLDALHDSRRRAALRAIHDHAHLLADERERIHSIWLQVYW